ncbi:MAG: hypothetical protein WDO16_09855 [Bacteroidota bacterium]
MNLPYRIDLLVRLGEYILADDQQWMETKEKASRENGWFIPAFIELATNNIAHSFLQKRCWKNGYLHTGCQLLMQIRNWWVSLWQAIYHS